MLITSLLKYQVTFGHDYAPSLSLLKKCQHLISDWDVHLLILNQALEICPLGSQVRFIVAWSKNVVH